MPAPQVEETSHPWLNYDSNLLSEALYNDNTSKRHSLAVRIRRALGLDSAEGFDLVDVGMHNYAFDSDHAPVEFAIVDRQYPHGLLPSQVERARYDLYDAGRVAELLSAAGFDGVYVDRQEKRTSAKGRGLLLPPVENDGTVPWSDDAEDYLSPGFVLPSLIEARYPDAFTLSLPSPLHEHTALLLRAYGRCLDAFPDLVMQVYAWFRSWGTSEFRPLTVALLLVTYMQRSPEIKAPDLQNIPSTMIESVEHTVWMPYRATANGSTVQLPLTVRYAPSLPHKPTEGAGVLFAAFIKWLKNMKSAYHGSVGRSTTRAKHVLHRPVRAIVETKGWGKHAPAILNAKPSTTEPWTWQPLIVVDAFVPTFNRAFEVSRELLESLFDLVEGVNATLSWGAPLVSAFGPALGVPLYRSIQSDLDDGLTHSDNESTARPSTQAHPVRSTSHTSTSPHVGRSLQLSGRRFYSSQSSQNRELRDLINFHALHTQPPPNLVRDRHELVRRIESAIQRTYGPRYTVEVFGSSRYGMDKRDSDLDLVICDSRLPNGFPPDLDTSKRLPAIYNPWNISKALNAAQIHVRVDQVIKTAAVPIVKLTDRTTHIRCDICCNDRLGLRNTELLAHYTSIFPTLRVVVKALKRWAKPLGLNEPSPPAGMAVTLSSYSLTLLAIGLFQARGILPNLQDVPSSQPGTKRIFYARTRAAGPIKCNVGWDPLPLPTTPIPLPTTEQMLLDFFKFYGYEHDYAKDIVSVRLGGVAQRQKEIALEGKEAKETARRLGVWPLSGRSSADDEERWAEESGEGGKAEGKKGKKDKKGKGKGRDVEVEGVTAEAVAEVEAEARAVQEEADAVIAEDAAEESVSDDENDEDEDERASTSSVLSQRSLETWTEKDERLSNIQPELWRSHALVVADPFIRSKNTAGNLKPDSVLRFRAECQRAYTMLTLYHREQAQSQRSGDALLTVLKPYAEGEDVLPTGPLPPLPEKPVPKKRKGNGKGKETQQQQANVEAAPSTSTSAPAPAPRVQPTGQRPRPSEPSHSPGSRQDRWRGRPNGRGGRGRKWRPVAPAANAQASSS